MLCGVAVFLPNACARADDAGWQNPFRPTGSGVALPWGAPPGTKPPTPTLFSDLAAAGFSFQNKLTDPTQGGSIGQSSSAGKSGFQSQFAAAYRSQSFYGLNSYTGPYLVGDLDGNIDTSSTKSRLNSVLNARLQVGKEFSSFIAVTNPDDPTGPPVPGPGPANDVGLRVGPMFETTEDTRVRNALFEISAFWLRSANDWLPNFGGYTQIGGTPFSYLLYPTGGIQVGHNLHGLLLSREFDSTRLRINEELIASLSYITSNNAQYFGLTSVSLTADDAVTENPLEGKTVNIGKKVATSPSYHNLITTSLNFNFGSLSVGPSYSIGQTPPLYTQNRTFGFNMKLKLGTGIGFLGPVASPSGP